ncbi:MAG: ABC transporter permease [Oscillospiraceae bacterium]|nr:ABC transporter permease [Oscillospiraceae bacterium]
MNSNRRLDSILRSKTTIMIIATIVVAIVFTIINNSFLSLTNLKALMVTMSLTGTIAIGMTMLLISGEVDLAAGGEAAMGGIRLVFLIQAGVPWPLALLLTIIFGIVMGLVVAFLVNKLNLMGFIATIGMSSVYTGLTKVLTGNKTIPIDQQYGSYYGLGSGVIFNVIPVPFLIMVVLMVIYGLILYKTNFGRGVYLTGGNRAAARLCGINRSKITTILYMNNGALCAFAGAALAARMHNASAMAAESGALDAITAAVLGGVSFAGGVGNMGGCFVGICIMTVFSSGLTGSGLQAYWQIVVQGLLLVAALCVDFFNERSRRKALEKAA